MDVLVCSISRGRCARACEARLLSWLPDGLSGLMCRFGRLVLLACSGRVDLCFVETVENVVMTDGFEFAK